MFSVARCPLPVIPCPMPISFSEFRVHRYHGLLLERRYIIKSGHAQTEVVSNGLTQRNIHIFMVQFLEFSFSFALV